jgi:hypothetical protein
MLFSYAIEGFLGWGVWADGWAEGWVECEVYEGWV